MTGFLDKLLVRNLSKSVDGDALSGNKQEWVRPRTPSLFEPTLPGTSGPAMQDAEENESQNTGVMPHWNSDPRRQSHTSQVRPSAEPAALGATPSADSPHNNAALDIGQERAGNSAAAGPVPGELGRNRRMRANNIDETAGFDTRSRSTESQLRHLIQRSERAVLPLHDVSAAQRAEARTQMAAPAPSLTIANSPMTPSNTASQAVLDSALRSQLQARAGQSRLSLPPHDRTHDRLHYSAGESGAGQRASNIQVSIGRIEIRAVSAGAPAPSPTRKERPTPQAIGLDEYLRQRASGGRE